MNASWGKVDTPVLNSREDRIELIDDTTEARAKFSDYHLSIEAMLVESRLSKAA